MVRRSRLYWHHAIDVGDGTVIHYAGSRGQVRVVARDSWQAFANDQDVHVRQHRRGHTPEIVLARAFSALGERRYSIVRNNCEHFATWCSTSHAKSRQVRDYLAWSVHTSALLLSTLLHDSSLLLIGLTGIGAQRLRSRWGPTLVSRGSEVATLPVLEWILRDDDVQGQPQTRQRITAGYARGRATVGPTSGSP